jgi:hypothetical protein
MHKSQRKCVGILPSWAILLAKQLEQWAEQWATQWATAWVVTAWVTESQLSTPE